MQASNQTNLTDQIWPQLELLSVICGIPIKNKQTSQIIDGIIIFEVLTHIKYFQSLQSMVINHDPKGFTHYLSNLKLILKCIHKYWNQCLRQQMGEQKQIDLISITKDKNIEQTKKLLKIVFRTLFNSQQKQVIIQKILETSQSTQQYFMKLIKQSFIEKKSQTNQTNSSQNSLFQKILELEHQNQRLLKILNQIYEEKQQIKFKQIQLEQKLIQKQKQNKQLQWRLSILNCEKKQTIQQMFKNYTAQKKINQKLMQQIKQHQIREKQYLQQLQTDKNVIRDLKQSLKQFNLIEQQLKIQNNQNMSLKIENQNLNIKIVKLNQTINQLNHNIKIKNQINQNQKKNIQHLNSQVQKFKSNLVQKQQTIQQLQENIKLLTISAQSNHQSTDFNIQTPTKSSIKTQCQQIINSYQQKNSHLYLLNLNNQIQYLKSQLLKTKQQLSMSNQIILTQKEKINQLNLFEQQNIKLVQMISHMNNKMLIQDENEAPRALNEKRRFAKQEIMRKEQRQQQDLKTKKITFRRDKPQLIEQLNSN